MRELNCKDRAKILRQTGWTKSQKYWRKKGKVLHFEIAWAQHLKDCEANPLLMFDHLLKEVEQQEKSTTPLLS